MTKPKKIVVKYIASNQKATVKKDDDIKTLSDTKQDENPEGCPFC